MNGKIYTLKNLATWLKRNRKGKKVGLITGCFDILHIDHIKIFAFAKKHVDMLIVGVDNDFNVKHAKGNARPIFKLGDRLTVLSNIETVDMLFPIKSRFKFDDQSADLEHEKILIELKPDIIFSHYKADKYVSEKARRAKKHNIRLKLSRSRLSTSSSKIIRELIKYGD